MALKTVRTRNKERLNIIIDSEVAKLRYAFAFRVKKGSLLLIA